MARGDGTLVADGLGVLGKLRDGRALAVLTRAAALPAFALPAVRALGRLGRKEAASTLLAALGQPELRQAAERALVALGRPGLAHGVVVSRDEARQQWVVADGRGESRAFSASVVRGTGELRVGQPVTFFPFEEAGRTSAAHVAAVVAPALAATGSGVEAEGVVRWYDPAKGLGFVRDAATGGDVLVSFADIDPAGAANATGPLRARQRVRYVRFPTARGFRASSVAPLGDTAEGTNATATHG